MRRCQGALLGTPERVPFRLTHNMVDALGLSGYEGRCHRCLNVDDGDANLLHAHLRWFPYRM
jgi:hypothetical protein